MPILHLIKLHVQLCIWRKNGMRRWTEMKKKARMERENISRRALPPFALWFRSIFLVPPYVDRRRRTASTSYLLHVFTVMENAHCTPLHSQSPLNETEKERIQRAYTKSWTNCEIVTYLSLFRAREENFAMLLCHSYFSVAFLLGAHQSARNQRSVCE